MSEELEVLKIVTQRLKKADINYMISGSIAANYYTIPRMTRDIDVVIELKQGDIDKFIVLFESDFYVNREMITDDLTTWPLATTAAAVSSQLVSIPRIFMDLSCIELDIS